MNAVMTVLKTAAMVLGVVAVDKYLGLTDKVVSFIPTKSA